MISVKGLDKFAAVIALPHTDTISHDNCQPLILNLFDQYRWYKRPGYGFQVTLEMRFSAEAEKNELESLT